MDASRSRSLATVAALAVAIGAAGWWLLAGPDEVAAPPEPAPIAAGRPDRDPVPLAGTPVGTEGDPAAPLVDDAATPAGHAGPVPIALRLLGAPGRTPLERVGVFVLSPRVWPPQDRVEPVTAFCEDGVVRWTADGPDVASVLLIPADPDVAVRRTSIELGPGRRDVLLPRAGRVTGQIVDEEGAPRPASLRVVPLDALPDGLPSEPIGGLSDPLGRFDLRQVPVGSVRLQAIPVASMPTVPPAVLHASIDEPDAILGEAHVQVVAGATVDVLVSPIAHALTWLSGVLRVDGRPAPRWAVRTTRPVRRLTTTDADGAFDLGQVPAGEVALALEDVDAPMSGAIPFTRTLTLAPGAARRVELELQTIELEGVVVDARAGHPVPYAPVRARPAAPGRTSIDAAPLVFCDAAGRFRHAGLPPGRYVLEVGAVRGGELGPWRGHGVARLATGEVAGGRAARDLRLALEPVQRVRGVVIADGLAPTAFPILEARGLDAAARRTAVVQPPEHRFTFEDLPPGRWRFELLTGEGEPAFAPLERERAAGDPELTLRFERAAEPPPD